MKLHQHWNHKWVNPKIEIKKSLIHGNGSFARELINKGEVISINGGLVVPVSEAQELRSKLGSLRGLQISDDFLLTVAEPHEAMVNHSCEPNVGLSDAITTTAIHDILPGEEVLYSYYFSETCFEPFPCTCTSPSCRKIVKTTGWKDDMIFQERYAEYFSPYIKNKITKT